MFRSINCTDVLDLTVCNASGPVVSTDFVAGPAEILRDGEYGPLVPVGHDAALASAILATLDDPPPRQRLVARGMQFTADHVTERYAGCGGLART